VKWRLQHVNTSQLNPHNSFPYDGFMSSTHGFSDVTVSHITLSSESESHVTTNGQSASLSWNKAPFWGLRPDFYYCQTVAAFLMWGSLSDEWTGLSFTVAPGPRQLSHFRVQVPWDSWPCLNSRLPFSSLPTTRRATVEVFDPASKRVSLVWQTAVHVITSRESNRDHFL
jgi:hypothetical protein